MYLLVCSITSIESLAGFRVSVFCNIECFFFGPVGARGVFSLINKTFSQEEGSGRQEKSSGSPLLQTSGRFTTWTKDLCTVQQKAIIQCPLVYSWGC